jgi:hypothetical protein
MAPPHGRARVAIINDDTAFLDLMRELLEVEENFEVLIWLSRYGVTALPKPFDLDVLLATIEQVLAEHGRSAGPEQKI